MANSLIITLILACLSIAASPPILNRSLASQLLPDNPAVSSAFIIPSSSALLSNLTIVAPALRVPPSWSFSIGFLGDTFLPARGESQKLSYNAQLDTGDPLPDWLQFDGKTITFGGVTPMQSFGIQVLNIVVSAKISSLSTSDTFTLIVSPHDLSLVGPLLTRNVTADTKFSFVIDDWQGVQVDGARLASTSQGSALVANPADTNNGRLPLTLSLNTGSFPWLSYDPSSRTLSGTPPTSYANVPGPCIPAIVTLSFPPRPLTVSTNITLEVVPSSFTLKTLPAIVAPPGTALAFELTPFLSSNPPSSMTLDARLDPQNATWLTFDSFKKTLDGTVPKGAPPTVKVTFVAFDPTRDADSRAEMLINTGGGSVRTTTDRALRKTRRKVSMIVGLVCGIIAGTVFLACFLALCRRYCSAHEHVDGTYVIDQSAFDEGLKSGGAYEKESGSDVDGVYLASPARAALGPASPEGRMITKGAFFSAMRERFGSDGTWRGRRTANSSLGSSKRARKSKISKPMQVVSSSTSVRDGFADRARGGPNRANILPYPGVNFTIFGTKNNLHGSVGTASPRTNSPDSNTAPIRPPRADVSLSLGRVLISPGSSPGTSALPYDRSRSASDPSQKSNSGSGGANSIPDPPRSGSAPSVTTGSHSLGTQSGTQSTFATGDSTRLTNAAGEVPFRRPGFDGRRETLAERKMREMNTAGPAGSTAKTSQTTATSGRVSPPKVPLKAALKTDRPAKPPTPSKSSTSLKSSTSKHSPQNLGSGSSSKSTTQLGGSKPSEGSLPAPSSYRNVFFGDKGNESDGTESSTEDAENAVIRHAVQRTSKEALEKQGTSGKPRLVAFTHERTPTAAQIPRRDMSQKVVVHGMEEGDPEAEMRMGLEYVRQLGHPEPQRDITRANTQANASTSRMSLSSNHTDTQAVEFYASNDSNGSIAGRTRVMSHLVIDSHRQRHQTAYSTESAHDSYASSGGEGETRWMIEAELPRVLLGPGEPFNFAAPLDRTHKHTSALAGSALEAKRSDGRPLPEWLRFRNVEREFWGVSPKAANGEGSTTLVTRVVVNIWEAEKAEVVGGCVIDVFGNE